MTYVLLAWFFAIASWLGFYRYGKSIGWRMAFMCLGLAGIVATGWAAGRSVML